MQPYSLDEENRHVHGSFCHQDLVVYQNREEHGGPSVFFSDLIETAYLRLLLNDNNLNKEINIQMCYFKLNFSLPSRFRKILKTAKTLTLFVIKTSKFTGNAVLMWLEQLVRQFWLASLLVDEFGDMGSGSEDDRNVGVLGSSWGLEHSSSASEVISVGT